MEQKVCVIRRTLSIQLVAEVQQSQPQTSSESSPQPTVAPLKSYFRLPSQAFSVPKIEFRPPHGSSEDVDLRAASARARRRRRRRRRSVRARPLRASQTPHQYGNSLPMVPMHNFEKPCTAPFRHRKPLHSSAATSAPLHPPPQSLNSQVRKIRRCARPKCAQKFPHACPQLHLRQINLAAAAGFAPRVCAFAIVLLPLVSPSANVVLLSLVSPPPPCPSKVRYRIFSFSVPSCNSTTTVWAQLHVLTLPPHCHVRFSPLRVQGKPLLLTQKFCHLTPWWRAGGVKRQ